MGKLRALKYIDDESFARDWALARAENRGYGPIRIEQELRTKGVSQSLIREITGAIFGSGDEEKNARALLEKKFRGVDLRDPKTLRRAGAFLERRGYRSAVIFALVRRQMEED